MSTERNVAGGFQGGCVNNGITPLIVDSKVGEYTVYLLGITI